MCRRGKSFLSSYVRMQATHPAAYSISGRGDRKGGGGEAAAPIASPFGSSSSPFVGWLLSPPPSFAAGAGILLLPLDKRKWEFLFSYRTDFLRGVGERTDGEEKKICWYVNSAYSPSISFVRRRNKCSGACVWEKALSH